LELEVSSLLRSEFIKSCQEEEELYHHLGEEGYLERDGIIFYRGETGASQIVLPRCLQIWVLELYHDLSGHWGEIKTRKTIQTKYFWINMDRDIREYVRNCSICEKGRLKITKSAIRRPLRRGHPFFMISIDHVGPLPTTDRGSTYVLTIVDVFTSFTIYRAVNNQSANATAVVLLEVFLTFGVPSELISDQGTAFLNEVVYQLNVVLEIYHHLGSAYRPQTNGSSEAANGKLNSQLLIFGFENMERWDLLLPLVMYAVNSSPLVTQDLSPFEYVFGRRLDHIFENNLFDLPMSDRDEFIDHLFINLRKNWIKKFQASLEQERTTLIDPPTFQINESVWVFDPTHNLSHHKKFRDLWVPAFIHSKQNDRVYEVQYESNGSIRRKTIAHIRSRTHEEKSDAKQPIRRTYQKKKWKRKQKTTNNTSQPNLRRSTRISKPLSKEDYIFYN